MLNSSSFKVFLLRSVPQGATAAAASTTGAPSGRASGIPSGTGDSANAKRRAETTTRAAKKPKAVSQNQGKHARKHWTQRQRKRQKYSQNGECMHTMPLSWEVLVCWVACIL